MRRYCSFGFDEMNNASHLKGPLSHLGQVSLDQQTGGAACVPSDVMVNPFSSSPSVPNLSGLFVDMKISLSIPGVDREPVSLSAPSHEMPHVGL